MGHGPIPKVKVWAFGPHLALGRGIHLTPCVLWIEQHVESAGKLHDLMYLARELRKVVGQTPPLKYAQLPAAALQELAAMKKSRE